MTQFLNRCATDDDVTYYCSPCPDLSKIVFLSITFCQYTHTFSYVPFLLLNSHQTLSVIPTR